MSRTLSFVGQVLAQGRKLHRLGVTQEALSLFRCLAGLHQLPIAAARQVQEHLACIHLKRHRYMQARRHLAALLTYQPSNPKYHYQMARAVAADPHCDNRRAVTHCRRAAELAPRHGGYLSTLGLLMLRQGTAAKGLACLRRAAGLAADDPAVVGRLVKGLCLLSRADEARSVLRAALFRNPGDLRFQSLWRRFQFAQLHQRQQQQRRRQAAPPGETPTLLPFVRPAAAAAGDGTDVRVDGPSLLPAPHLPRPVWRPDQRHAQ
jgi:Tfp pilus assembly protein PilF